MNRVCCFLELGSYAFCSESLSERVAISPSDFTQARCFLSGFRQGDEPKAAQSNVGELSFYDDA